MKFIQALMWIFSLLQAENIVARIIIGTKNFFIFSCHCVTYKNTKNFSNEYIFGDRYG